MAVGLQNIFGAIRRFFARTSVQRSLVISAVFISVLSAGAYATSEQFGLMSWLRSIGNRNGLGNAGQVNLPTGAAIVCVDTLKKRRTSRA